MQEVLAEYSSHLFLLTFFIPVGPFQGKKEKQNCDSFSEPEFTKCLSFCQKNGAGSGDGSLKGSIYSESLFYVAK